MTVLGLDVSHTGAEDGQRPAGDSQAETSPGTPSAADGDEIDEDDGQAATTTSTVRIPAAGSSVDVLA